MPTVRQPFVLGDGSSISIQASAFHYCTPRDNTGPYTHFEVWPDAIVPGWDSYSTGADGHGPYANVPQEQVQLFITLHGGLAFVDAFTHRKFVY